MKIPFLTGHRVLCVWRGRVLKNNFVCPEKIDKQLRMPRSIHLCTLCNNRPCHGFRRHLDEWANALEISVFV